MFLMLGCSFSQILRYSLAHSLAFLVDVFIEKSNLTGSQQNSCASITAIFAVSLDGVDGISADTVSIRDRYRYDETVSQYYKSTSIGSTSEMGVKFTKYK